MQINQCFESEDNLLRKEISQHLSVFKTLVTLHNQGLKVTKVLNVRSGANIPGNIRMSFVMSGAQMVETHVETQGVIRLSYSNTFLT